ncbi:MAG TPA: ATP-binding protein [Candidatus Eisenbacteria bacterium]|nr:ATP-binding protein [Candidatus Eisenbacteria bacterium]
MPARRGQRPSPNGKANGDSVLARLAEALFVLRTSPDLGALVDTVAAAVRSTLHAKESHVFLIEERTGAVRPWDAGRAGPGEAFLPMPNAALESTLRSEEPLFVAAPSADLPALEHSLGGKRAGAFFCMPLRARGTLDGVWVATFGGSKAFTAADRLAAHLLADALALGLERSRSDRFLAERALAAQRLEARAEEGEGLLGQMLSVVAHEMRTPLTCIKAYAETLIDAPADEWESRAPFLEIINEECDRLGRLLMNALDYSRLESGQKSFHLTTLKPEDLVTDALLTMAPEGKRRKVEVSAHVPETFGTVEGDLDLLKQLCLNLVSNAIKFSPEPGQVEVVVSGDEEGWRLEVMDRGPGIPEDQAERIFERFYRVEQEGRRVPGSGLGLAIARNITELHGGRIVVTPRVGGGSVFTVTLPRVQRAPDEACQLAAELWERRDCLRLLDDAVALASEALEAQIVSLMLVDPQRGDLKMAAALGLDESALKRRVGFRGGVGGQALAQAAPVLVNDIETDPRFRRPNHPQYSTKSLICVPLIVAGRSIGVINVNNKRSREAFGEADLALLANLVDRVCSAVERSLAFPESPESPAETMAALRASIHLREDLALGQRPAGAVAYGLARRLGANAEEARLLSRLAGGVDLESVEAETEAKPSRKRDGRAPVLGSVRDILLGRSERWDGKGVPRGLAGEAIPLGARILSAVDLLHDLTHGSPHRQAVPAAFALEEMERLSGSRLDPRVQAAVTDLLADEVGERRAGRSRREAA